MNQTPEANMRHLQLIQGGAQEPQQLADREFATYSVETVRTGELVEVVLRGPARPEGLVLATLRSDDEERIERARRTARELAEERNFDLVFGATQAIARVNRAIDLLVVSANRPVLLDYDRGPRNGRTAEKVCIDFKDVSMRRSCAADYVRAIFDAARKRAGETDGHLR